MADKDQITDLPSALAEGSVAPSKNGGKRAIRRKMALSEGTSLSTAAATIDAGLPVEPVAAAEHPVEPSEVLAPAVLAQGDRSSQHHEIVSHRHDVASQTDVTADADMPSEPSADEAMEPVAPEPVAPDFSAIDEPEGADAPAEDFVSKTTPASPFAFKIKDMTMDMSANISSFQTAMTDAQAKAQAAFEKSSSMLGEAGEFAKGNVEAVISSSKILADGMQEIGGTIVAESRTAFESMTGDIKELAAAKSPTDFLKIQSEMVRKNFDNAVAYGSKNSETFLKLMSDVMAPLSGRVSLAVEKARQVAPMSAPAL